MSKENVEVVRRALDTWAEVDQGLTDPQKLAAFFAPDSLWDLTTLSGWPGRSQFRGVDEFLEFRTTWIEPYDDYAYEVEQIREAGPNRVVATFHQRGKLRDSEAWVEMRYGVVYTVDERMIREALVFATAEEAIEAAGLSK